MDEWNVLHAGEEIIYTHKKTYDMWKKNTRTGKHSYYHKKQKKWIEFKSELDEIANSIDNGYQSPFI